MSTPVPLTLEEWRRVHFVVSGHASSIRAHLQALESRKLMVSPAEYARALELERIAARLEPFTRDPRDKRAGEAA